MTSVWWLTNLNAGLANALGYSWHNKAMYSETSKLINCDDVFSNKVLQIVPADQFVPVDNKINVLFSMFEMLDIPQNYIEGINKADYLIVPCHFCKELFRKHTTKPIYVVQEGIYSKDYPFYQRRMPDFSKGERFRIYWSGAPNPRKGYHYALEVLKYVERDPRFELYMKTTFPKISPEQTIEAAKKLKEIGHKHQKLDDIISGKELDKAHEQYCKAGTVQVKGRYQNILFDTRRVEQSELLELYNRAHLFIFPTMGEGWGLMGTEALATGCPIVAPRITALTDWFDDSVGYVCKHDRVPIKSANYKGFEADCYVPNLDSFLEKIWEVYNNYDKALERGRRGSKRIHEQFTWELKAKRMVEVLEQIDKRENQYKLKVS